MFVQNLNQRQQACLLYYADAVMRADGKIDPQELVAMDALRNQSQPGLTPEEIEISDLPNVFKLKLSRVSFLLELVGIGYINEDFDPAQSKLVRDIAEAFDLHDCGTMSAVEQWVRDQFSLLKQAQDMMEE